MLKKKTEKKKKIALRLTQRNPERRRRIVCIGGGTGVSVVLSGLKKYPVELAAVISMFDSAGSGGKLREELGILPPGDIRQCLLSLSGNKKLSSLCNFRFEKGSLSGHSFGNLLIAAANDSNGGFEKGIEKVSELLDVKGKVVPVTLAYSDIKVLLNNGKRLENEDEIVNSKEVSKVGIKKIFLEPEVWANKKANQVIREADLIVIGPGKLYTSLLPNFLAKGIKKAVLKSKAKKILICNLMSQAGNTDNLKVEDFVAIFEKYLAKDIFDYIIFNTGRPKKTILKLVQKAFPGASFIKYNKSLLRNKRFIGTDILDRKIKKPSPNDIFVKGANKRTMVLHDNKKLARILSKLW